MNASVWFGILLLGWAALVIVGARPLHARTRELIQWMRGHGLDPAHLLGARYVASPEGLRGLRVVGAVVGAIGVALIVRGLLR